MPSIRWTPNRLISFVLYTGFIVLTGWGGMRAVNYSLDSKFYKDYLIKWEVAARAMKQSAVNWPAFQGGGHVKYMEDLIRQMQAAQITVPVSNTRHAYMYIMDKIGPGHARVQIFVLCLPDRLILYDLPETSFERTDRFIDGNIHPKQGRFQGKVNRKNRLYTGIWKL